MSFKRFINKNNLENKATSNIKVYHILCSIGLNNVGICLPDRPFESDIGIVNLHPWKRTHWVCYKNENYFDNYGAVFTRKLSWYLTKRSSHCLFSEYKIQGLTNKRDSYCASYCLYIIYLTIVLGIDFKPADLNLHYEMIK